MKEVPFLFSIDRKLNTKIFGGRFVSTEIQNFILRTINKNFFIQVNSLKKFNRIKKKNNSFFVKI